MAEGMRRMGIAVAALSLLLVTGPASATFADDRDTPGAAYDSGWQGLHEEIHPVAPGAAYDSGWQGLDQEIHPVAPGTAQADPTESVQSSRGTSYIPVFALALGLGLATSIAVMAAASRRRTRPVHAG